jgi:preprotein translocase subunit SecA
MRIFAGDRVRAIMDRLKLPEGEPIEAGMVSRSIETAQRKVEGRNFDVRKQLLEYDDVANDQRKVLYAQRNEVLEAQSVAETVDSLRTGTFTDLVATYVPEGSVEEQWDIDALQKVLEADWQLTVPLKDLLRDAKSISEEDILEQVLQAAQAAYQQKVEAVGAESWSGFERSIMLQVIDTQWREHLSALDHLRQGIHLRGYAQKNPKQEYKREAFELFSGMLDRVRDDVVRVLMTVRIQTQEEIEQAEAEAARAVQMQNVQYQHTNYEEAKSEATQSQRQAVAQEHPGTLRNAAPKVGRNDPCPCGSGKKYKHCHGQLT